MRAWAAMAVFLLVAAGARAATVLQDGRAWRFVELPKGCFQLGSDSAGRSRGNARPEPPNADELPRHEVCVSRFWLAETELTIEQWNQAMGLPPASDDRKALPVTAVDMAQVDALLARLNSDPSAPGRYRLPSEAEWEYGCRAGGAAVIFRPGDDPQKNPLLPLAWNSATLPSNEPSAARPVAGKQPNAWGLYDMLGNVWELTADHYATDGYRQHALFDPLVLDGRHRVIRGGGFRSGASQTRCGVRNWVAPEDSNETVGVRLVLEPARSQQGVK